MHTKNGGSTIDEGNPAARVSDEIDDLQEVIIRWMGGFLLGAALVALFAAGMSFFI